jgi:hypothetical protein
MTAAMSVSICASILFPQVGSAQDELTRKRDELASVPQAVPADLSQQLQALGSRMRTGGKEESVFEGRFLDAIGQQKPLRVIHQISGVVRIESPSDKTSLNFDGDATQGIRDHDGESLLDTFVSDSPEGMIYAIRNGASMQLLGRGFVSDAKRSDPQVPRYDIYEVTASDRTNKASGLRVRRYYFDSQTGLLASTRYTDRNGVSVETRFLAWTQVDGAAYPSRIERYENGRLTFSFIAGTVAAKSKRDPAVSR